MMPPENFNAFGNRMGQLLNFSRFSTSSNSSNEPGSTSSSLVPPFQINGLLVLYSPTFLFHDLSTILCEQDTTHYDQSYLTIMPRSVKPYEGKMHQQRRDRGHSHEDEMHMKDE